MIKPVYFFRLYLLCLTMVFAMSVLIACGGEEIEGLGVGSGTVPEFSCSGSNIAAIWVEVSADEGTEVWRLACGADENCISSPIR